MKKKGKEYVKTKNIAKLEKYLIKFYKVLAVVFMVTFINVVCILWGIIYNFSIFTMVGSNIMASVFGNAIPAFLISFICIGLSLFSFIKYKTKVLSSISIILNIIPIGYFILLLFALG